MPRVATVHRCADCGAASPRWVGRCPECAAWNTLREEAPAPAAGPAGLVPEPVVLRSLPGGACHPRPTGLDEVDRVLAGGFVDGSVTLLYGEPGVGKSTLLLAVLGAMAAAGGPTLLVSAEESGAQVRARAERIGALDPALFAVSTADAGHAEAAVRAVAPSLVVVDSVQTLVDPAFGGGAGSVLQVRACAARLSRLARELDTAVVLVGHVTKTGDPAGPRTLEHLVDTVLAFEGDRHHALRLLRADKHRFGPTGEVGLFEMGDAGVRPVGDPGPLLLGDRRTEVPGSAVSALLQGRRSLLVEIQALACAGGAPGRRTAIGLEGRRMATVAAVLEARAGVALAGVELFASAAGGVRATEPAADLPMALAVASAVLGVALPPDLASFGEIGLAGEVRQVTGADRRLAEIARLGFATALVPASCPAAAPGLEVHRVRTVSEALAVAGVLGASTPKGRGP